jgi:hypothetical protein
LSNLSRHSQDKGVFIVHHSVYGVTTTTKR